MDEIAGSVFDQLITRSLSVPFQEGTLRQRAGSRMNLGGPGSIEWEQDGLAIQLSSAASAAIVNEIWGSNTPSGQFIKDDGLFDFRAVDGMHRGWTAEREIPSLQLDWNGSSPLARVTVHSQLHHVTVATSHAPTAGIARVFIPCRCDWIWGGTTVRIENRGGKWTPNGWRRNREVIDVNGFNYYLRQVKREEADVGIVATFPTASIEEAKRSASCLAQSLMYVCAQATNWEAIEFTDGTHGVVEWRRMHTPSRSSYLRPPLPNDPEGSTDRRSLLQAYMAFALARTDSNGRWSALSNAWWHICDLGADSVYAAGLLLAIAIEVMLTEHRDLSLPIGGMDAAVITQVKEHLAKGPFDEIVRARLIGVVSRLGSVSAKDGLRYLVKRGVLTKRHVKAWEDIRNGFAHSGFPEKADQSLFDNVHVLLDAAYMLSLQILNVRVRRVDYASIGWPTVAFEPADLGIADSHHRAVTT
ncbi:MAG: hypothetical protein ACREJO_16800 [Phycisphaerales bacterium]